MKHSSSLPKAPADTLTEEEQKTYEWQMWTPDFGLEGQKSLKNSSVLISRCGGVGSVVAYEHAWSLSSCEINAHGCTKAVWTDVQF